MQRWLTVKEAALELRITTDQLKKMMSTGLIQYIQTGTANRLAYRILDPAPSLREHLLEPRLERFPLITVQELAEVIGVSRQVMQWHHFMGHIKAEPKKGTQALLFTPKEVRRFIAAREGRRRQSKYSYANVVVKWLKGFVADCTKPNAEIVSELIRDAVALLPEPERSQQIAKLWGAVDLVNKIIKDALGKKS